MMERVIANMSRSGPIFTPDDPPADLRPPLRVLGVSRVADEPRDLTITEKSPFLAGAMGRFVVEAVCRIR